MFLQSKNHQNSWNSLVITPTTIVDVHSSCLYAGVDGINFAVKDRQHLPPQQNQDPQPSSDPKGKKDYLTVPTLLQHPKSFPGPKEAQSSLGLRPTSAVQPIRGLPLTRAATSASLEASPPRPSTAHRTSASLEATPRLTELVTHLLTCPSDKGIK